MDLESLSHLFGFSVIVLPAILLGALGIPMLLNRKLSEQTIATWTKVIVGIGLCLALLMLAWMLSANKHQVSIDFGQWVAIEGDDEAFHFHVKFIFDRLSVPFAILSYALCGTVAAFATKYLHRESGFGRFFICYAVFFLGMVVSSLAGTIETLFFGWEFVGLSSALLVAYFFERQAPVINGLRIWCVYRVADAAFLIAAVVMHHLSGDGDFEKLTGRGDWPQGISVLTSQQAFLVGLLLLVAAAGKSGLIPFSGWLPRAMEGPTPSSAVFYGALSVHLGAFLLLRVNPILEKSILLSVLVIMLGVSTAIFASLTSRVQTDAKSVLAFASLTQVSLIVAEIGLFAIIAAVYGIQLQYFALVHIIGHACLRTLQLLRAPTLLRDYQNLENAIGMRLASNRDSGDAWIPANYRRWWYRFALERGYLDAMLDTYICGPFTKIFRWCDARERKWTDFLEGKKTRKPDNIARNIELPGGRN